MRQSWATDGSEKLLLEADITDLEMTVSSIEALLPPIEHLKCRLDFAHATIVRLVEAQHNVDSERVQTSLEKKLTMLARSEKWLQHTKDSCQGRLTLSKAVHSGEARSTNT